MSKMQDYMSFLVDDPATSAEVLDYVAQHPKAREYGMLLPVAEHPNTSTSTLSYLVLKYLRDGDVMTHVARHSAVSAEILAVVSRCQAGNARSAVAESRKTPSVVLRRMIYDSDVGVATKAILNPMTPLDEVIRLRGWEINKKLREAIEERIEGEGVVGLLDL